MTITEAAIKYRQTEDNQQTIEEGYIAIDDAESELNSRHVEIRAQLKNETDVKRIASLNLRLKAIENELSNQNTLYETLQAQHKTYDKVQRDLEKVFGKSALYKEYDRLYHGK